MSRRLPFGRRLTTAARWPVGILLTAWHYMWRTTPIARSEVTGGVAEDAPPGLTEAPGDDLQLAQDGAGPFFHRVFELEVKSPRMDARELMRRIQADPNTVSPSEFAHFGKVAGEEGVMRVGDEFIVRMPGPWDGPVRVLTADDLQFRLVTLRGHLEAGQIRFRASDQDGRLSFRIETWARSGDWLSDILYDRLRFAKEVQLHMWTSVLERVEQMSGGRRTGSLLVRTARLDHEGTERMADRQRLEVSARAA